MFKFYNSAGDLARAAIGHPNRSATSAWTGGETHEDSIRLAINGDDSLVPEAEKMMGQLEHQLETPNVVWERAVAGAFPVVPDFLAGELQCMRTREPQFCDRSPIRIMANITSSGGVGARDLRKRGIAILSLVMALSQTRPVELIGFTALDGSHDGETILAYRVNTQPLDLATACYTLTSAGFPRNLGYGLSKYLNNFGGGWPRGWSYGRDNTKYMRRIVQMCGGNDNDLIIDAVELGDTIVEQPVKWINQQLARYNQPEEIDD